MAQESEKLGAPFIALSGGVSILLLSTLLAVCPIRAGAGVAAQTVKKATSDSIRLDATVTIFVNQDAPGPIVEAAQDLQSDFEKVFGKKPSIVRRIEDAGAVTVMIGEKNQLPDDLRPAGVADPESFSISVAHLVGAKSPPNRVVLLAGADMRGTIYAIYEFSEEFLGVDPLYYWTDHEPVRHSQIELPASLNKQFPSPLFKYRGFFINDEDLLTGWAPGEAKDHTGISLAVWNKVFETIFRL